MLWFKKKPDLYDVLYRTPSPAPALAPVARAPDGLVVSVDNLRPYSAPVVRYVYDDGEKFAGGYGATEIPLVDLRTLRARSDDLFERNLFARGLIRRIVENMVATGLTLESLPIESLLGLEEDSLEEWQEDVETRFNLWAKNKKLCDYTEQRTFGEIQQDILREALVCGDCVVVNRASDKYKVPQIEVISGTRVQSPGSKPKAGHRIVDGVELDARGRHVAYWVSNLDAVGVRSFERLECHGDKTGRRLAWMVYGSDKRIGAVRGKPLLAIVLQSLKEIDRFRDATQRKAGISATIAGYVKRTADAVQRKIGAGGFGAVRKGAQLEADSQDGETRRWDIEDYVPGVFIHTLEPGEEIQQLNNASATEHFAEFQDAILRAVAFCCSVPPEVFLMSYDKSFSASQAANNDFKIALATWRRTFGTHACSPVYEEWLVREVLRGKIKAQGLSAALKDPEQYDVYFAWLNNDWCGQVKPAVDLLKLVKAYSDQVAQGFMTRTHATMELNGSDFRRNVKKLAKENALLALANAPNTRVSTLEPLPKPAETQDEDESDEAADALRLVVNNKEDHEKPRTDAHLPSLRGYLRAGSSRQRVNVGSEEPLR